MSLWRAKRRQVVSRRFSERADRGLLALNALESQSVGIDLDYDSNEIKNYLVEAAELLRNLGEAIASPATTDDHHYGLSKALMDRWELLEPEATERLLTDAAALDRGAETLEIGSSQDRARKTLKDIEEIASRSSDVEERRLRQHFAT